MHSRVSSCLTHALVFSFLAVFLPVAMAQANVQGQWSTLSNTMPINPVHVALLNNGKVLVVAGSGKLPAVAVRLSVRSALWPIKSLWSIAIGSSERPDY